MSDLLLTMRRKLVKISEHQHTIIIKPGTVASNVLTPQVFQVVSQVQIKKWKVVVVLFWHLVILLFVSVYSQ